MLPHTLITLSHGKTTSCNNFTCVVKHLVVAGQVTMGISNTDIYIYIYIYSVRNSHCQLSSNNQSCIYIIYMYIYLYIYIYIHTGLDIHQIINLSGGQIEELHLSVQQLICPPNK